ncbi:MAG: hypothetical protein ACLFR2_04595 [Candidatus Kapaibacterium sp.]
MDTVLLKAGFILIASVGFLLINVSSKLLSHRQQQMAKIKSRPAKK